MSSESLRAKLFSQRPDLREYVEPAAADADAFDVANEVDDKHLSLEAWKTKGASLMKANRKDILSEDEIRKMFAPRPLTTEAAAEAEAAPKVGIVRAVKKSSALSDEAEAKDFLVDEEEGLIGSQG